MESDRTKIDRKPLTMHENRRSEIYRKRLTMDTSAAELSWVHRFESSVTLAILRWIQPTRGLIIAQPVSRFFFSSRSLFPGMPIAQRGARRRLHERREPRLERLDLPRMDFEVRMQTDEIRKRLHAGD